MTIKNYTFFSQSGTEFPVSATADRRLYLMLGGMDYSTFKMTHWKATTNTALNRVYNDTSLVVGGAYFELKNQSITLRANATNFIHANIDLSNVNSPVSLSTETKDNSNSIDMNTKSSVLKKCIEIVTTRGTEITKVIEKEQKTKLKKVNADSVTVPRATRTVSIFFGLTANLIREGNIVTVNFERQTKSGLSEVEDFRANETIPLGFRPSVNKHHFNINRNSSINSANDLLVAFGKDGAVYYTNNNSGTFVYSGSTTFFTSDAMP